MSIQAEIDAQNARQSRIDNLLATTPPHQLKRLEAEKHQAALALARVFGHRLHQAVADRLVEGLVLEPETLVTIPAPPRSDRGYACTARPVRDRRCTACRPGRALAG